MSEMSRVVFCQCAYAQVVPRPVKEAVHSSLRASGIEFESIPDLCELAARRDPRLKEIVGGGAVMIAACYPRAVRWLFAAAGVELSPDACIFNMRTQPAEEIVARIGVPFVAAATDQPSQPAPAWKPWFPVIDFVRCTNCMQCLSFCLFDVFGVTPERKIAVKNPANCKTDCPACSRVCPEVAIIFPKYRSGPINGDEVGSEDARREKVKVDISALLGGDVYAMLRDRSARTQSRFSRERDESRALEERKRCLARLQQEMDIPPELLSSLPSLQQVQAKAEELLARLREPEK